MRTNGVVNHVGDVAEQRIVEARRNIFDADSWFIELKAEEESHKLHDDDEDVFEYDDDTKMDLTRDKLKREKWMKKGLVNHNPIYKKTNSVASLTNVFYNKNIRNNSMDRSYKLLDKSVKNLKRMEHKSRVVSGKGKKYGKKYRYSNVAKYLEDVNTRKKYSSKRRNLPSYYSQSPRNPNNIKEQQQVELQNRKRRPQSASSGVVGRGSTNYSRYREMTELKIHKQMELLS